jgi:hypothetical protein
MPWLHTPELAYSLEALRVTEEMRKQGVMLDPDQAHALAQANLGPPVKWVARVPEVSEKAREILDGWTRRLALDQHALDHRLRQPHDHGRLREEGVEVEVDHDRLQLMGLDRTAPPPKALPQIVPKPDESDNGNGSTPGGGGSRGRGRQEGAVRNGKIEKFLAESRDALDFDDDDEE